MISIKKEIQEIMDKNEENETLPCISMKKSENLHPNYQLLVELSKQGILDDWLIIKLQFF